MIELFFYFNGQTRKKSSTEKVVLRYRLPSIFSLVSICASKVRIEKKMNYFFPTIATI